MSTPRCLVVRSLRLIVSVFATCRLNERLTIRIVTFTEEEKKRFQDREKAREFRIALEQDMNVSALLFRKPHQAHQLRSLLTCSH